MSKLIELIASADYATLCWLKQEMQAYSDAAGFDDALKAFAVIRQIDDRLKELGYGSFGL